MTRILQQAPHGSATQSAAPVLSTITIASTQTSPVEMRIYVDEALAMPEAIVPPGFLFLVLYCAHPTTGAVVPDFGKEETLALIEMYQECLKQDLKAKQKDNFERIIAYSLFKFVSCSFAHQYFVVADDDGDGNFDDGGG
jgi:hypothetical protein